MCFGESVEGLDSFVGNCSPSPAVTVVVEPDRHHVAPRECTLILNAQVYRTDESIDVRQRALFMRKMAQGLRTYRLRRILQVSSFAPGTLDG